jgi:hypothetical protein
MEYLRPYQSSQPFLTGNDILDTFHLNVTFSGSYLEQRRAFSDRRRGLRDVIEVKTWRRTKELGRGGFGIVYLEEDEQGNARAVKEVPRAMGKQTTIDPLREITAMAAFSKVRRCSSRPAACQL